MSSKAKAVNSSGGNRITLKRKELSDDNPVELVKRRSTRASTASSSTRSSSPTPSASSLSDAIELLSDSDGEYDDVDGVDDSDVETDHRMADIDSSDDERRPTRQQQGGNDDDHTVVPASRDFSQLTLKPDHDRRPIWVCPNGRVFLDTRSAIYKQAYDFLIAISDPVCRPQFIHEYQITSYSLYAAASLGLQTEDIVSGLTRLSKVVLDERLVSFIKEKTLKCGKVKLVLHKTRYYIESIYPDVLNELLKQDVIENARIDDKRKPAAATEAEDEKAAPVVPAPPKTSFYADRQAEFHRNKYASRIVAADAADDAFLIRDPETGFLMAAPADSQAALLLPGTNGAAVDQRAAMGLAEFEHVVNDDDPSVSTKLLSIEVSANAVEDVRRRCNDISYPLLEEYDFRRDTSTPDLPIHLKPSAQIRDYQEKSLSKMFGNGRSRSGIIVLPCGAGKTLVGITAAATVKKSTLVFCTTGVAVDQWRRQFLHWSTLPSKYICQFTSSVKDKCVTDSVVLITTYNMVSFVGKRSAAADEVMSLITSQEWGLVILGQSQSHRLQPALRTYHTHARPCLHAV